VTILLSAAVSITGLTKAFRSGSAEIIAVGDLDVEFAAGSITAVTGQSGSGKSTLLLSALTALDNVIAPVLPFRESFDKEARGRELLAAVGLAGREGSLPSQLSGGQQQRVAIARALIGEPRLLLADEPTGSLDSQTGDGVMDLLVRLHDQYGTTVLIATHEQHIAARCDRLIRLSDGKILEDTGPLAVDSDGAPRGLAAELCQ
jgi:putative ABC transport system ATP-binding protein